MNLKQRFADVFIKFYSVVIYYFAILIVTGYIGTYTLGLLMSSEAETGFDPAMIIYMILGAFVIAMFGWPMLLIAAFMYAILFPFMARMSLRFIGPVLLVVSLVALLQARFLSKMIADFNGGINIALLAIAITIPTHLLTISFGHAFNRRDPMKALIKWCDLSAPAPR